MSELLVTEIGGVLPRVDLHLHSLLESSIEHIAVKIRIRVLASFVRASYCICNLCGKPNHVKFRATNFDSVG